MRVDLSMMEGPPSEEGLPSSGGTAFRRRPMFSVEKGPPFVRREDHHMEGVTRMEPPKNFCRPRSLHG